MPKVTKQQTTTQAVQSVKRKTGTIADRIVSVSDHVRSGSKGMTVSIYGRSGTGKTTLVATWRKPLLLLGAEDGTRSIGDVAGVDFLPLDNSSDIEQLREVFTKYNTIALDTASSLQEKILAEILGRKLPEQLSWGVATREQWGQCALRVKECLRVLLDQAYHGKDVIIIAQEREFNTESDKESSELLSPYVCSALTPSVVGWLNTESDYICQTFMQQRMSEKTIKVAGKEVKTSQAAGGADWCLRLGASSVYITRFRLPRGYIVPDVIVDPTYEKILAVINQKTRK